MSSRKIVQFCKNRFLQIIFCVIAVILIIIYSHIIKDDVTEELMLEEEETVIESEELISEESINEGDVLLEQWEKGYELVVDELEEEEAENDFSEIMELVFDIYIDADKGVASNIVLEDEDILMMQDALGDAGYSVTTSVAYSDMENYECVDSFLLSCMNGEKGSVVYYQIYGDGSVGRMKFIFDGIDMYVVSARSAWTDEGMSVVTYISYTRIDEWEYTEKGWFGYILCVPEPPEVSEIVDGSTLVRITPLTEEQRQLSELCVQEIAYIGNNILCTNWDVDNMQNLDFNGVYEFLYVMEYGIQFDSENYSDGIPKEEFESLVMKYFPITSEELQEYASFDEENQCYPWVRLGCSNHTLSYFSASLPEVIDISENEDGTLTLTVEAVCDMLICNDAVITHELTVQFTEDGEFQYLGNEILNDGISKLPDYQYRIQ